MENQVSLKEIEERRKRAIECLYVARYIKYNVPAENMSVEEYNEAFKKAREEFKLVQSYIKTGIPIEEMTLDEYKNALSKADEEYKLLKMKNIDNK